jgi:hypothetical protein
MLNILKVVPISNGQINLDYGCTVGEANITNEAELYIPFYHFTHFEIIPQAPVAYTAFTPDVLQPVIR